MELRSSGRRLVEDIFYSVLMQTLNVGAGRTDEEYKAAEQQRLADLRAESRNNANYFFIAAGLAALGSGLLPVRVSIFF